MNARDHWEKVYNTRASGQYSWTQELPQTSLDFLHELNLPKTASIIDVGGGDSKLADCLIDEGYRNITVLDISAKALQRAKNRLGGSASRINWVCSDILEFVTTEKFDCWHDRATFHFLTSQNQITRYLDLARKTIRGNMILATFSEKGPEKCSGLTVKRYSEVELKQEFANGFEKIKCKTEDHLTPFNTEQNFIFCSFRRIS